MPDGRNLAAGRGSVVGHRPPSGTDLMHPAVLLPVIMIAVGVSVAPYGFLFPAVVAATPLLVWIYRRPVIALSLIIPGHLMILERTENITVPEIIFGVFAFGFIAWWFIDRLMVSRVRICDHPADWFLAGYLLFAFLSVFTALAAGSELFPWLREFLTVATLFLYFPLRSVMKGERERKILVGIGAAMIFGIALNNILNYGLKALAASYFWELQGARQAANAHFFFPAFVVAATFLVHLRKPGERTLVFVFWATVSVALLLTFARGFWFGSAAGLLAILLASPGPVRKRMLTYGGLIVLVAFLALSLSAGDFTGRLAESLLERLTSSGKTLSDISLRARFVETRAVLGPILSSPLIGNGYGTSFSFFNVLTGSTLTTVYMHNGYLFLLFKVGIIGSLPFLAYLATILLTAWKQSGRGGDDGFTPALIRGALGVFVGLLLITITSNVFIEKESLLVISVFGAAVISSVPAARN